MILYGALFSPFVRKVAVACEEKGVAYEIGKSGPMRPDDAFLAASPFKKMPAIRDGDFTLADSSAIIAYLDAKHPSPPLIPAEPQARGRTIWFDEFADTVYGAAGLKIAFNRIVAPQVGLPVDAAAITVGEAELPRSLDYLESVAPAEGWLAGDFSLADISVASILKTMAYCGHGPDAEKYPKTAAWYGRVAARAAWGKVAAMESAFVEKVGFPQPACI